MKKKLWFAVALAVLLAWPLGSAFAYESLIGPTGVLQWDKTATQEDMILLTSIAWTKSYMIDREGYIINVWETGKTPGLHDRFLENGNLLRAFSATPANTPGVGAGVSIGGAGGGVEEITWDGKVVWRHVNKTNTSIQHHTFYRKPDGNTLILLWEKKTCAEAYAMGRDAGTCTEADGLWPDAIEEVDATPYPGTPKVVRKWRVWDHTVQDRIPGLPNYGNVKDPKKFHLNFYPPNPFGYKDWNHGNTVEYNVKKNEVIFNSRNWGEFYVIDWNDGPTFGQIKFRWGNPCAYGEGKCPSFFDDGDQKLWGPHCVTFLDNGNYLAFDNGWARPSGNLSRAVEVNPALGPKGAAVWTYQSSDPNGFFTTFQGGAGRLPNGNTFITSTDGGHLFEVTPGKKVVWEFILPGQDTGGKPICTIRDTVPTNIHRAHAYDSKTHKGFVGKDLSRKGHIAQGCPEMWKLWDTAYGELPNDPSKQPAVTGFGTVGTTGTVGGGTGGAGGAGSGGAGGGGY